MNFFTADLHFGHANVIRYCGRPYQSVQEMDSDLIKRWNAKVKEDDNVYILGDFSMRTPANCEGYLIALNRHKHLIVGNHDRFARQMYRKRIAPYFKEIVNYKELIGETGCRFVLMHYPILFWNGSAKPAVYHLYGHIHNSEYCNNMTFNLAHSLNVGVDVCDYAPISEKEAIKKIRELDKLFSAVHELTFK